MKLAPFALSALALAALPLRSARGQAESPAASAEPVTMVRMYDGAILWARIVGHDAESLFIERVDNAGRLALPWSKLDPSLADELLERFGYVDHSGDDVMIEADRLVLVDGRELIGLIVNRTEDALWLKTAQAVTAVPKLRIRGAATTIQVPALEVYTRDELYQQGLARLDPASASSHIELATWCERILDFAHAVEHLTAAQTLDPAYRASEVEAALARNRVKVENQAQIEALSEIDHLRIRGFFGQALAKCDEFLALYERSPLRADATKKKGQVEKAREAKLREKSVELWHLWLGRAAQNAARKTEMTLEATLAWLDEGLHEEVLAAVHKELARTLWPEISPDHVAKYWAERQGGRFKKASYGQGTWLLGDGEARKGLEPEKDADKPKTETDAARAKLEERIRRYLDNQQMVLKAKAKTAEGEESEEEKFWAEYPSFSRAQWMLAYYAEHSGDMQLRDPGFSNCPDCGGRGVREIVNVGPVVAQDNRQGPLGAKTDLVKCPTCHGVGVFRRVWYR
jgi:hypothetical protein